MLFKKVDKGDKLLTMEEFLGRKNHYRNFDIHLYDECYVLYQGSFYITIKYDEIYDNIFKNVNLRLLYIRTSNFRKELFDFIKPKIKEIHICCFVNLTEINFQSIENCYITFKLGGKDQNLNNIFNIQKIKHMSLTFIYDGNNENLMLENINNSTLIIYSRIHNITEITLNKCNIKTIYIDRGINRLNINESYINDEINTDNCKLIDIRNSYVYYVKFSKAYIINIYKSTFNTIRTQNSNILILNNNKISKLDCYMLYYVKFGNINEINNLSIRSCKVVKINPYNIKENTEFKIEKTYISNFKFYYLKTAALNLKNTTLRKLKESIN